MDIHDLLNPSSPANVQQSISAVVPDIVVPDVVVPDVIEPDVIEPDVIEPDIVLPDIVLPDVVEPDIVEPAVVEVTLLYHGKAHKISLFCDATITELSEAIADDLSIPAANQKLLVAKIGLLKIPFKDPNLPISSIIDKKITLVGSTGAEAFAMAEASDRATRRIRRRNAARRNPAVEIYTNQERQREERLYTFLSLKPLPYLPNPEKSLAYLQRLKNDIGIKTIMRKFKFTIPLLTEMDPAQWTEANTAGTTRILGLNRNFGEVIELRLRTDANDGYRDYKTIRKTLCHELAHNIYGPHDRDFWELCGVIEREVASISEGGRTVDGQRETYFRGVEDGEDQDEGGWTGGEFVLGRDPSGGGIVEPGMSRREILARAAEERRKRVREEEARQNQNAGSGSP